MKKIFNAFIFLGLIISAPSPSAVRKAAAEDVNEHKLALTSGTLKMGGAYGTTSAYYKLVATWCDYPETADSQYLDAGFIVNSVGTLGSINMSYYANYETWSTLSYGSPYGAVRVKNCSANRIGSGTGEDGFIETTKVLRSATTSGGQFFSEVSNPVTLRYDAEAKARTLPSYTYGDNSSWVAKGEAKNYSGRTEGYTGFQVPYFGIGWYVGPFSVDLTNLCFYDDDYNSLGCTVDANPTTCSLGLYGKVGDRIYVGGLESDAESLIDQNGNSLPEVRKESDGVLSFVMPDYDVTVTPKQKETEINVTIDGNSRTESIEWNLDNLKSALDVSDILSSDDIVIGYKFDGKLYETVDGLYEYINTLDKSYSLDVEVVSAYLKMNKQASIRNVVGSSGLRFTGKVRGNVDEYGMIVTKYSNLESFDKFTMEDMAETKYRKVSSLQEGFNYIDKTDYKEFSTVIVNMKEENLIQQYIARLYVKVTYATGETKTIYSAIDESYLTLPYETGLISAVELEQKASENPGHEELYDMKREEIHRYYDSVCNIDNSYHLIGNGRNYTVEKVGEGRIKIKPLNDFADVSDIKYLLINGVKVNFTVSGDTLSFDSSYIDPIEITNQYSGGEMDIYSQGVRGYLEADTASKQASYLSSYSGNSYDKQTGSIKWKSLGSFVSYYLVYVSEDDTFLDNYCFKTTGSSLVPGVLIPNRTYFYKVVAISDGKVLTQSDVDTFVTNGDFTLRQININGVNNVRDEGGWTTESGETVKYSLLYRGACLNGKNSQAPTTDGLYTINNVLNWKTEIDFRTTNSDDVVNGKAQTENAFNSDYPYVKGTLTQALYIFPGWSQTSPVGRSYDSRTKNSLKAIFANLSDINNYPAYFHCNAGADRTGTFGYIALGLLGVSYEDLCKDFELTSFSCMGKRWRSNIVDGEFDDTGVMEDDSNNFVAFGKMHQYMMDNYGTGDGKISSAVNNYLVNAIGVPQEQIDSFRSIML